MKKIIILSLLIGCLSFMILTTNVQADENKLIPFAGLVMGDFTDNTERFVDSESPLGIFGVKYETKYVVPFYRHISSIPQIDESRGMNEFGVNFKYNYKMLEPYVGYAYNGDLSSEYYTDQIDKHSYLIGLNIEYDVGDLFIEYRKSDPKDMYMFGFLIEFDTFK